MTAQSGHTGPDPQATGPRTAATVAPAALDLSGLDTFAPWIEIVADDLAANLRSLRQLVSPGTRLALVLKANAYGHGRDLIAAQLGGQADYLATAEPDDALSVHHFAPGRTILLGPVYGPALTECIARGVQVAVSSDEALPQLDHRARVHLHVDTGLHRLGVLPERAAELADAIRRTGARLVAAFCMVSAADSGDWESVAEEIARLRNLRLPVSLRHYGGSSLILERPDLVGDIGRTGLAYLGYRPRQHQAPDVELAPTMRLFARIIELRSLPAGARVGYQRTRLERQSRVATLPVGAGHGLPPGLADGGQVLIRGIACPIIGGMTLDYLMVDVTQAPDAALGDAALVLGGETSQPTAVETVARRLGLIVDHVTSPLSSRIPRRLV